MLLRFRFVVPQLYTSHREQGQYVKKFQLFDESISCVLWEVTLMLILIFLSRHSFFFFLACFLRTASTSPVPTLSSRSSGVSALMATRSWTRKSLKRFASISTNEKDTTIRIPTGSLQRPPQPQAGYRRHPGGAPIALPRFPLQASLHSHAQEAKGLLLVLGSGKYFQSVR